MEMSIKELSGDEMCILVVVDTTESCKIAKLIEMYLVHSGC